MVSTRDSRATRLYSHRTRFVLNRTSEKIVRVKKSYVNRTRDKIEILSYEVDCNFAHSLGQRDFFEDFFIFNGFIEILMNNTS